MRSLELSKSANASQDSFHGDCDPSSKAKTLQLLSFSITLVLATSTFAQEKSEAILHDTGSDLLWKKLEKLVDEVAARLDGVFGRHHCRSH